MPIKKTKNYIASNPRGSKKSKDEKVKIVIFYDDPNYKIKRTREEWKWGL